MPVAHEAAVSSIHDRHHGLIAAIAKQYKPSTEQQAASAGLADHQINLALIRPQQRAKSILRW
eukprot:4417-Heterococcus_DN1.PRE.1